MLGGYLEIRMAKKTTTKNKEKDIKRRSAELGKAEKTIKKIYIEIEKQTKHLAEKEEKLQEMAVAWKHFNDLSLEGLHEKDVEQIVNNQQGFVKDLLEHYINNSVKETEYGEKITSLEKENEVLRSEIDHVLEEIKKLEE